MDTGVCPLHSLFAQFTVAVRVVLRSPQHVEGLAVYGGPFPSVYSLGGRTGV